MYSYTTAVQALVSEGNSYHKKNIHIQSEKKDIGDVPVVCEASMFVLFDFLMVVCDVLQMMTAHNNVIYARLKDSRIAAQRLV